MITPVQAGTNQKYVDTRMLYVISDHQSQERWLTATRIIETPAVRHESECFHHFQKISDCALRRLVHFAQKKPANDPVIVPETITAKSVVEKT